MILFECADCLTECYANEVVCSSCGADLTNEVDASDYDCDDDDGQPSEMQEWHDFDPDCQIGDVSPLVATTQGGGAGAGST